MGREVCTRYKAKMPRPDAKEPVFDDSTGDAAKDGYTRVGPRRPVGAMAGDIMEAEEAREFEEMRARYGEMGIAPYGWSDW